MTSEAIRGQLFLHESLLYFGQFFDLIKRVRDESLDSSSLGLFLPEPTMRWWWPFTTCLGEYKYWCSSAEASSVDSRLVASSLLYRKREKNTNEDYEVASFRPSFGHHLARSAGLSLWGQRWRYLLNFFISVLPLIFAIFQGICWSMKNGFRLCFRSWVF